MKRGEIWFCNLNPTIGKETNKVRLVLILSNDINNIYSDTVTILPISGNIEQIYQF